MKTIQHKFVEFIPEKKEEGILYISIEYCTAIHKCVCGCGEEVVTPISPTDWELTFYGDSISLYPSIGNWSFNCKSHYWIRRNKIIYASIKQVEKQETIKSKSNKKKILTKKKKSLRRKRN